MVMEYVQGKNLEQYLHANGIFSEFENTSNFTPALDIYALAATLYVIIYCSSETSFHSST
jgi:serine/threonine protein kinase